MNLTSPITLCQRADAEAQRGFDGRLCAAIHNVIILLVINCTGRQYVQLVCLCKARLGQKGAPSLQVVFSSIVLMLHCQWAGVEGTASLPLVICLFQNFPLCFICVLSSPRMHKAGVQVHHVLVLVQQLWLTICWRICSLR